MPYNFEERYNEIREQLISQGYANKHITYSEFLAIYEPYKEEMSEKEFIHVLGITLFVNLAKMRRTRDIEGRGAKYFTEKCRIPGASQ